MPIETIIAPVGKSDPSFDLQADIIFGGNGLLYANVNSLKNDLEVEYEWLCLLEISINLSIIVSLSLFLYLSLHLLLQCLLLHFCLLVYTFFCNGFFWLLFIYVNINSLENKLEIECSWLCLLEICINVNTVVSLSLFLYS